MGNLSCRCAPSSHSYFGAPFKPPIFYEQGADPVWIDDSASQHCWACATPFTVFTRRHHCRCCGQLFCFNCFGWEACLPEKWGVPSDLAVPVCLACRVINRDCPDLRSGLEWVVRSKVYESGSKNFLENMKVSFGFGSYGDGSKLLVRLDGWHPLDKTTTVLGALSRLLSPE
eukprot:g8175.t1